MAGSTIDTIEMLLESALEKTDDPEVHFKLRTSLQLLAVLSEQEQVAREALEDCDIDMRLRHQLRDLGYLSQ